MDLYSNVNSSLIILAAHSVQSHVHQHPEREAILHHFSYIIKERERKKNKKNNTISYILDNTYK